MWFNLGASLDRVGRAATAAEVLADFCGLAGATVEATDHYNHVFFIAKQILKTLPKHNNFSS